VSRANRIARANHIRLIHSASIDAVRCAHHILHRNFAAP